MALPNLVQIRPWGGLLGKWMKYNRISPQPPTDFNEILTVTHIGPLYSGTTVKISNF